MAESSGVAARTASETCPACGGTGWQIVDDGGNGAARACECRAQRAVAELLARASIPERHSRCRLESFYTKNRTAGAAVQQTLLAAKRASELFIEHFIDTDRGRHRATGLLFMGPPGTGKTHLATAVLHELIERYRVRGRFVNFSHLVYQLQSTFDPSSAETRRQILDPITRAEVLVLDELGATKPTDWVQDQLYLIINERYVKSLPTLFTTNYRLAPQVASPAASGDAAMSDARILAEGGRGAANPFAGLDNRISKMLVSRLYEMAVPIQLGDWDYRERVMRPRQRA